MSDFAEEMRRAARLRALEAAVVEAAKAWLKSDCWDHESLIAAIQNLLAEEGKDAE